MLQDGVFFVWLSYLNQKDVQVLLNVWVATLTSGETISFSLRISWMAQKRCGGKNGSHTKYEIRMHKFCQKWCKTASGRYHICIRYKEIRFFQLRWHFLLWFQVALRKSIISSKREGLWNGLLTKLNDHKSKIKSLSLRKYQGATWYLVPLACIFTFLAHAGGDHELKYYL